MNDQSAWLVQAIRGPVMLITIGVLFAFDRFTDFHFGRTWPVLLIVAGLLRLGGRRPRRDPYFNPNQSYTNPNQPYPNPSQKPGAGAPTPPGAAPPWDEPGARS
jgi:hypothetical protein